MSSEVWWDGFEEESIKTDKPKTGKENDMPFDKEAQWDECIKKGAKADKLQTEPDFSRLIDISILNRFSSSTVAFTCPKCGSHKYKYQGLYRDYETMLLTCSKGHFVKVKSVYVPLVAANPGILAQSELKQLCAAVDSARKIISAIWAYSSDETLKERAEEWIRLWWDLV
jgi:hypothetical protein